MLIHSFRIEDWIPMSGNNRKWDLNGFFLAETGEEILFIRWIVSIASIAAIICTPKGI